MAVLVKFQNNLFSPWYLRKML